MARGRKRVLWSKAALKALPQSEGARRAKAHLKSIRSYGSVPSSTQDEDEPQDPQVPGWSRSLRPDPSQIALETSGVDVEHDLMCGESVRIGNTRIIVIDFTEEAVTFQIDASHDLQG